VQVEGLVKLKNNSMTSSVLEPTTFRLVVPQQINLAKFNSVSQEDTASVFEVVNILGDE
jgi:hypothetical protein